MMGVASKTIQEKGDIDEGILVQDKLQFGCRESSELVEKPFGGIE
jgi:hypothetical protein